MEVFRELGELVELRWRQRSYRESALPQIAHDALVELALHDQVSWRDLLRWCIRTPLLDTDNHQFGDVPLRVFESSRFFVEVLIWRDGELAIHDHGFAGAFSVLSGASLHIRYGFRPDEMLNTGFGVGELSFDQAEPLAPGDVRTIEAGRSFVHAVYHMASPTVSLVVRSRVDVRGLPQLMYMAPGIAFDRGVLARDAYAKPLAALRAVSHLDRELHRQLAIEAVQERDAQLAFEVVMRAARGPLLERPDELSELCEAAAAAHPAIGPRLPGAVAAQIRLLDLLNRRRKAAAPELQLLFALLLNVPRRAPLLDVIAALTGAEPTARLLDWLQLAGARNLLPSPLDTRQLDWLRDRLQAGGTGPGPLDRHLHRVLAPLVDDQASAPAT